MGMRSEEVKVERRRSVMAGSAVVEFGWAGTK